MKIDLTKFKAGLKCNHCKDEIYSMHRHDLVSCKCGKIFVDGGDDYMRIGGYPKDYTYIQKPREVKKKEEKKDGK